MTAQFQSLINNDAASSNLPSPSVIEKKKEEAETAAGGGDKMKDMLKSKANEKK